MRRRLGLWEGRWQMQGRRHQGLVTLSQTGRWMAVDGTATHILQQHMGPQRPCEVPMCARCRESMPLCPGSQERADDCPSPSPHTHIQLPTSDQMSLSLWKEEQREYDNEVERPGMDSRNVALNAFVGGVQLQQPQLSISTTS
jgi:hypothetical protein